VSNKGTKDAPYSPNGISFFVAVTSVCHSHHSHANERSCRCAGISVFLPAGKPRRKPRERIRNRKPRPLTPGKAEPARWSQNWDPVRSLANLYRPRTRPEKQKGKRERERGREREKAKESNPSPIAELRKRGGGEEAAEERKAALHIDEFTSRLNPSCHCRPGEVPTPER